MLQPAPFEKCLLGPKKCPKWGTSGSQWWRNDLILQHFECIMEENLLKSSGPKHSKDNFRILLRLRSILPLSHDFWFLLEAFLRREQRISAWWIKSHHRVMLHLEKRSWLVLLKTLGTRCSNWFFPGRQPHHLRPTVEDKALGEQIKD